MATQTAMEDCLAYLREAYPGTFKASSRATAAVWADVLSKYPDELLPKAARQMAATVDYPTTAAMTKILEPMMETWEFEQRSKANANAPRLEDKPHEGASAEVAAMFAERIRKLAGGVKQVPRDPTDGETNRRRQELRGSLLN